MTASPTCADDECAAHPLSAATDARSATALLERIVQIGARGVERRQDAEDDTGHDGQRETEQQHPPVDGDREHRREHVRIEREHACASPTVASPMPNAPPDRRHEHGLGQQLSHQSRPAGAERGAERPFHDAVRSCATA